MYFIWIIYIIIYYWKENKETMKSSSAEWLSSASPLEQYIVRNIIVHFPDF